MTANDVSDSEQSDNPTEETDGVSVLLEQQRKRNHGKVENLMRAHQTLLNPTDVLFIRLNTVIDCLFGPEAESPQRQMFELQFERRIGEIIDQADNDVWKNKLLRGPGGAA